MVFGLGFIPLAMAYEYIKNRSKYDWEYFAIAVSYLISIPNVYYDYFFYMNYGELNFMLERTFLSTANRGICFVSGGFLLIKGLQEIWTMIIHKINRKVEK